MSGYFIHREPILDRNEKVVAYELIFRRSVPAASGPRWPVFPIDQDLIEMLAQDLGFEKLTGGKRAFVAVDSNALELSKLCPLPKSTVLQLTERDGLDKDVSINSGILKKSDFSIAIDYSLSGPGLQSFHQVADYVKVDISSLTPGDIEATVELFKNLSLKLVAINVHDKTTFDTCRSIGFELFRGLFFVRPSASGSESISDSQATLMQLSAYLRQNKDVALIEKTFKSSPKLTFGLLKLINSAFFGVSNRVGSIRHAITLLGYDNLQKWLIMLLFTVDHGDNSTNPLIEKAMVRAKVMELLAKAVGKRDMVDSAYMTGMLSYLNVLFNVNSEAAIKKLSVTQDIETALLSKEGFLGTLLSLVEKIDTQDYEGMEEGITAQGLTVEDILAAETDAVINSQMIFSGDQSGGKSNG